MFDDNVKKTSRSSDKLSKMEHGDGDNCAITLQFKNADQQTAFMREIASREIPVEMDDDGDSQCTVSGELRTVKRAYAFFWNAVKGTKYMSWMQFAKENPDEIKTFFDNVVFDGDIEDGKSADNLPGMEDLPDIDDIPLDDDILPSDDEEDFWSWYEKNQS